MLKKTFDSINYDLIIAKLSDYRLSAHAIHLIRSYLSDRHQVMKVGSTKSSMLPITCGVPQGSILGPILFLLTVNDLLNKFSTCYTYADDTLIFSKSSTAQHSLECCSQLLNEVRTWYANNFLQLNLKKTEYCIFSNRKVSKNYAIKVDDTNIQSQANLSLLGVILDSGLTLNQHVNKLCSKANSLVHLSSKFNSFLNVERLEVYTSIIRPHLEYCSSLLLGCSQKLSCTIESAQNRATRIILSAPKKFSVTAGRLQLNLPTLNSRRGYLCHKFVI